MKKGPAKLINPSSSKTKTLTPERKQKKRLGTKNLLTGVFLGEQKESHLPWKEKGQDAQARAHSRREPKKKKPILLFYRSGYSLGATETKKMQKGIDRFICSNRKGPDVNGSEREFRWVHKFSLRGTEPKLQFQLEKVTEEKAPQMSPDGRSEKKGK